MELNPSQQLSIKEKMREQSNLDFNELASSQFLRKILQTEEEKWA